MMMHCCWPTRMLRFVALMMMISTAAGSEDVESTGILEDLENGESIPPAHAVLFPSFVLTLGVVVFYVLSRYLKKLPYTAIMFLLGTIMGIGAELRDASEGQINETLRLWIPIDSEVLLLVFLPGLIFKDAAHQDVHLFIKALPQLLIFAFPMVLAGTTLTACIAFYIFPYNWSFNLAMTFGSILSATDPVAVAALLEQVGAPPRLKVHIAGESLLNDGAAIVFFGIFVERYFHELNVDDFGENIDLAKGVGLFLRKALGGAAIGIMFGLALLLMLHLLDRRYNREENVVQVSATIAIAYIGYYVAEAVWKTSGVIATVASGLMIGAFGRGMINDLRLLEDFWSLLEHLLNTVLFTLAGVVWGAVIADGSQEKLFTGKDWGYLVLLYILLTAIRALLFALSYPITSRIGLQGSVKETAFSVYAGLRGAVGLALALFLDNEVAHHDGASTGAREETRKLFGFVGGIAFMTLCINGSTAGPLLIKLGLADSGNIRKRIVEAYNTRFKKTTMEAFVELMTHRRFRTVNFALVRHHVPYIADMTKCQLMDAVVRHKETTPSEEYRPPYLKNVWPYLEVETDEEDPTQYPRKASLYMTGSDDEMEQPAGDGEPIDPDKHDRDRQHARRSEFRRRRRTKSTMQHMLGGEPLSTIELRTLFISILRAAYETQIHSGELEDRQFLAITLENSLDLTADAVAKGSPLQDWQYVTLVDNPVSALARRYKKSQCLSKSIDCCWGNKSHVSLKYAAQRLRIERSIAFMAAHRYAQRFFEREFQNVDSEMSEAGKVVLRESKEQFDKAEAVLSTFDPQEVTTVVSHKLCMVLLNGGVHYLGKLVLHGLLKEDEAEHMVEEIEECLEHVLSCSSENHPGETDFVDEDDLRRGD